MYRIFVIEDDDAINRLLCMNLSIAGYEPIPAKDGLEALKMIQNGERFDVAIVDVMLPGIDGFYLMEPLKAHGIPVIYLTAKNDLESKLTGLTTGAEDYIVKPFEVMELLVRMEKVLARHCSGGIITIRDLTIHVDERVFLKGISQSCSNRLNSTCFFSLPEIRTLLFPAKRSLPRFGA